MESATCGLGSGMLKLPGRLDKLLQRYSHMLPKGAEDEIPLIKRDLEEIIDLLQKSEENHVAATVKCWTKEVRELSYDIEDFLDQYEYAAAGLPQDGGITRRKIPRHKINRWRRSKTPCLPENLRQRLWMANKIREFSERAQEVLERHSMYNVHASSTSASRSLDGSFGARHPTPVVDDVHNHVGINLAVNELEERLMTTHGTGVHNLKVVSIVGFEGVGKTELANQLYRRLGKQFECWAFVRVSQKPDMRRIFISIFSQVCPHQCPDNWKVHTLISIIRGHLEDKRYLIVVDDLWAISTWEIIKSALPDGKTHSRILATTEIEDLALHCCGYEPKYVFNLKPLDEDHSRTLFFSSVFGPRRECPLELREVSHDITRKCCGLPLAIVSIASILTDYLGTQEQWDYVNKSLGCSLMEISISEKIKRILNLCYDNLPQCLKACMLYTSIYEAGNIIQKDDLVNEWIAEGFIGMTESHGRQEISRGYFDELVRRKMIQPVDINDSGEIRSCVVHHIVLKLMMEKSIEENFVTAIHHSQATAILADKVRRLSLHFGSAEDVTPPTTMRLSQVRTLAFFGVFKCMPSIVEFRLLQVLILHFWGDNNDTIRLDITKVSELFRLKYLKIASNVSIQLHTQMQGLLSLETLQIDARVTTVLSDITHLPGSRHLRLPAKTSLPNWIGHMTLLRTLRCIDLITDSVENLQNLSSLTNLQDIRLTFCSTVLETGSYNKMPGHLCSILRKHVNLRSLILVSTAFSRASSLDSADSQKCSISNHGFSSVHTPALLQRLELSPRICVFSCLPNFIGQLRNLCFLKIGINKITTGDIDVLRRLPSLIVLSLYVHTKLAERIVIGKDGFFVLKYFKLVSCDPWLKFEMDAMSNLRKLKLGFNARREDQQSMMPVGMEHLSGLNEVSAKIGGVASQGIDRITAELAFRDAIKVHARCPRVTILCVNKIIGSVDDETSIKREEEYGIRKPSEVLDEEGSVEHGAVVENSNRYIFSDWDLVRILVNKLENKHDDTVQNIPVFDAYTIEPWDFPSVRLCFCPQQKREPSRATDTESGYWQITGSPEVIYSADRLPVGVKRRMKFYYGRAPSSKISQWTMVEFSAFQEVTQGTTGAALQRRSEMSLCQLYTETTRIPRDILTYNNPSQPLPMKGDGATKQCTLTEVDTNEQDKMIQMVRWENSVRATRVRKRRKSEPRKELVTRSPDSDGFSWRKCGAKDIHNSKYERDYYRCAQKHSSYSCKARKTVQRRSDDDPPLFDVCYIGEHTCRKAEEDSHDQWRSARAEPGVKRHRLTIGADKTKAATSSSQSSCLTAAGPTPAGCIKTSSPHVDGYSWDKYRQKKIRGAKHPRAYYVCAHRMKQISCRARKTVQRTDEDPLLYDVTYQGQHTCDQRPTHSNDQGSGDAATAAAEEQLLPFPDAAASSSRTDISLSEDNDTIDVPTIP